MKIFMCLPFFFIGKNLSHEITALILNFIFIYLDIKFYLLFLSNLLTEEEILNYLQITIAFFNLISCELPL